MTEPWKAKAAETLREVASGLESTANALDRDDDILGAIAGMRLASALPALPKHIRDVLTENLTDEAAAGLKSDELYWSETA